MKKEDAEECATPGCEAAPPTAGEMEEAAPADAPVGSDGASKDTSDSNSPKESDSPSIQTDVPPQDHKGGGEGKHL